jgi:hypothetical protein
MSRFAVMLLVLVVAYAGSYAAFRSRNVETWDHDGRHYVIFAKDDVGTGLYYLWRPLSYLDGALTGTGAHIGPHEPVS